MLTHEHSIEEGFLHNEMKAYWSVSTVHVGFFFITNVGDIIAEAVGAQRMMNRPAQAGLFCIGRLS